MLRLLWLLLGLFQRYFRFRRDLLLENLTLRQQLLSLQRRNPKPRLGRLDKLFWVATPRLRSKWKGALVIVAPETVVRYLLWSLFTFAFTLHGVTQLLFYALFILAPFSLVPGTS